MTAHQHSIKLRIRSSGTVGFGIRILLAGFILAISPLSSAQIGVHKTLDTFLQENFEHAPSNETLWLNEDIRSELSAVLERNYRGLRIRYWRLADRTVWIMNELGKERPITSAVAVENDKIIAVSILEYRESRGGEVQLPSFRKQFINAGLDKKGKLNQRIDGITGATLSVRSLNRSVIAALKLHRLVTTQNSSTGRAQMLSKVP